MSSSSSSSSSSSAELATLLRLPPPTLQKVARSIDFSFHFYGGRGRSKSYGAARENLRRIAVVVAFFERAQPLEWTRRMARSVDGFLIHFTRRRHSVHVEQVPAGRESTGNEGGGGFESAERAELAYPNRLVRSVRLMRADELADVGGVAVVVVGLDTPPPSTVMGMINSRGDLRIGSRGIRFALSSGGGGLCSDSWRLVVLQRKERNLKKKKKKKINSGRKLAHLERIDLGVSGGGGGEAMRSGVELPLIVVVCWIEALGI